MEFPREGLLTKKEDFRPGHFEQWAEELIEINSLRNERAVRSRIVQALHHYCGIPFEARTESEIERDYQHYAQCITSATQSLHRYFETMLVQDILERAQPNPLVRDLSDPAMLIDFMATARNQRARFEARRSLHFGTLFFEYDYFFGSQERLRSLLFQIDLFFEALFSFGSRRNTRVYHKIRKEGDSLYADDVRVPLLDRSEESRRKNENQVFATLRALSAAHMARNPIGHGIYESRVKDRFSAALKSIRKGVPISSLKDILANTLYLYPEDEEALDAVVYQIADTFPIEPEDRMMHPARRADIFETSHDHENGFASPRFAMEKMITLWRPMILLDHRDKVNAVLPFSSSRERDRFWRSTESQATICIPAEIQVGLIENFLNNRLLGGDVNHRIYKLRQAVRRASDAPEDAVPILQQLLPIDLFGIPFDQGIIVNALYNKHMSEIGVYERVLEETISKE